MDLYPNQDVQLVRKENGVGHKLQQMSLDPTRQSGWGLGTVLLWVHTCVYLYLSTHLPLFVCMLSPKQADSQV